MKAGILTALNKIISKVVSPSAITPLYRCVELGVDNIRACSEFGNIEIMIEPTGLTAPCLVSASAVAAVAHSFSDDADIELKQKEDSLHWKQGKAKGHWALVSSNHTIPAITHKVFPWQPPAELADALVLGSSACQMAATSVGLFGMVIERNGDDISFTSSNSVSLASVSVANTGYPDIKKITLRPPVPAILSAILSSCPNCHLDVTADGIFVLGDWIAAHFPLAQSLELNLADILGKYTEGAIEAKIDSAALKTFLARAKLLTDRKSTSNVSLRVEGGQLVMEHSSLGASSEEYFLAEGLDPATNFSSVVLPLDLLITPLAYVEKAVLDYLPGNTLVLKGDKLKFRYIIGGTASVN
jgi:hypothetical protein